MNLARNLWIFWAQGAKNAPIVVKKCIRSWKRHNPEWKLILLDQKNISQYIKPSPLSRPGSHLQMAHQSDLLRLQLLYRYGGVWADATCYCTKPLNSWIDEATQSGFFAFSRPAPDRLISNWFLASEKNNPLPDKLLQELIRFFKKNKEYPYFIFHHIFEELVESNVKIKEIWQRTPKISAIPPHLIFHAGLLNPAHEDIKIKINSSEAPLFKLSWKYDENLYNENTILHYLLEKFEK